MTGGHWCSLVERRCAREDADVVVRAGGDRQRTTWQGSRRRRWLSVAACTVLVSCGSGDDAADVRVASVDAAVDTTVAVTDPTTTETTEAPEAPAPTEDESTATECLIGEWVIDGPQFVASAVMATGESIRYVSGRYLYTFSEDGTFDVAVEGFTIEIDGEEGILEVTSVGSENGVWSISALGNEEIAATRGLAASDLEDLPQVVLESTFGDVAESGTMGGASFGLGENKDQSIEGIGSLDCAANTLLVRADSPLVIDVLFTRL
jgi:hypothetical protein